MKPDFEDPFRPKGVRGLWYELIGRQVPEADQRKWFVKRNPERGVLSRHYLADGTLRHVITAQENGLLQVTIWDLKMRSFTNAMYQAAPGSSVYFRLSGDEHQVIFQDHLYADTVVDFRDSTIFFVNQSLEGSNPFCNIRQTAEFREIDL